MFVAQMSWARSTTERGNLPHAWSGNGRHHIQDFQRNFMNIGKRHKNIMDGVHSTVCARRVDITKKDKKIREAHHAGAYILVA